MMQWIDFDNSLLLWSIDIPPQKLTSPKRCSQKAKSPRLRTSTHHAIASTPSPNQSDTISRFSHARFPLCQSMPKIQGVRSIDMNHSPTAIGMVRNRSEERRVGK